MVALYQNGAILQNEEDIMDVVINRYFIPSVPWYNGTGWTVGIKLAHVVHLGPVPSVVHLGRVPSYPKCPISTMGRDGQLGLSLRMWYTWDLSHQVWYIWDLFHPIPSVPRHNGTGGINSVLSVLSQVSHGPVG